MMFWYRLSRAMLFVFFKFYNRIRIIAAEKVPAEGAVIVAANHASYLDPPVIGVSLPRQATFVAKEELFRVPFLNFLIREWSIPVNRSSPGPSAIKSMVKRLKEGGVVVIFPEGGIPDSQETEAKRGVGMLARLSGAKVVPVYIGGAGRALPPGSWFPRPARVTVRFGDPFDAARGAYDDVEAAEGVMAGITGLREKDTANG